MARLAAEKSKELLLHMGITAPWSFNGLMRHYHLREGSSLAEVQANLLPEHEISRTAVPVLYVMAWRGRQRCTAPIRALAA